MITLEGTLGSMDMDRDLAKVIQIIETQQKALSREEAMVRQFDSAVPHQLAQLRIQSVEALADGLKLALADQQKALEPLNTALEVLVRGRSRYLHEFLQEILGTMTKRVNSPLWLGSSFELLDELAGLKQRVDEFRPGSDPAETETLTEYLEQLTALLRKFNHARALTRVKAPLTVFIWGIPVWLGFLISGRATYTTGSLFFVILLSFAALAYAVARRQPAGGTSRAPRLRWLPSSRVAQQMLLTIVMMATVMAMMVPALADSRSAIIAAIARTPALLEVSETIALAPGTTVPVRLEIGTTGPTLYQARISLRSPLLGSPLLANTISAIREHTAVSMEILVPADAPSGRHPAELAVEYEFESPYPRFYAGMLKKAETHSIILIID